MKYQIENTIMHQRLRCALILFLFSYTMAYAADPKPVASWVDPGDRRLIGILFDTPFPKPSEVNQGRYWTVYSNSPGGVRRHAIIGVDASALDPKSKDLEKKIILQLGTEIPKDATVVDIMFTPVLLRLPPLTTPAQLGTVGGGGSPLTGATSKSDSDIYFNGSYTAVKDGDAIYDIDAFAGYMHAIQSQSNYYGKIGFYGEIRTKKSTRADPDSFLTYVVYQRVIGNSTKWLGPFQSPYLNYRFTGWEFDRSGNQLNFIDSPVVTFPVRLSGKPLGPIEPGFTFPHMTLQMGTEFVDVRESVLAPRGWHTRGLLGATFVTGYAPEKNFFDSIQLTSSWRVRLPSAPEIFYDDKIATIDPVTGKKGDPPPMLGTQPRHSLDITLSYNFTKWGGLTFEHTYGSTPPLFNKTNHSFAFGLTFTLKQSSYGRYSILRP